MNILVTLVLSAAFIPVGLADSSSEEKIEQEDQPQPYQPRHVQSVEDAYKYLRKHGYVYNNMEDDVGRGSKFANLRDANSTFSAMAAFQRMAGLNVTGKMDAETIKMMNMPRCGVPDFGMNDWSKRRKRFLIQGRRWSRTDLTYRISRFQTSRSIPEDSQRDIIRRALKVWSDVTPLTFTERPSGANVDIDIWFVHGEHGDGGSFDGRGGTLAHAFFPGFGRGGDAHFDAAEFFTERMRSGVNLFQVAAHEFGHSLGLGHSADTRALMAPFYRGYQPNFFLHQDDINGIRMLYGANQQGPSTRPTFPQPTFNPRPTFPPRPTFRPRPFPTRPTFPPRPTFRPRPFPPRSTFPPRPTVRPSLRTVPQPDPPTPSNLPDTCANARFDALFTHRRFGTFAFRGDQLLKLTDTGVQTGYPRPIRSVFPEFTTVDAALALDVFLNNQRFPRAFVFLFEGDRIIGYDLRTRAVMFNNVGTRNSLFLGLPGNIDAIFKWSRNGLIYAMKGDQYYRLSNQGLGVEQGYPRPLSAWNLPVTRVEAAVQYTNRRTYFFSGDEYYRFNDIRIKPDDSYPRGVGFWWLGCSRSNLKTGNTAAPPDVNGMESEDAADDHQFTDVETVYEKEWREVARATAPQSSALSYQLVGFSFLLFHILQRLD